LDDSGRGNRAECDRSHRQAPDHPEHACEDVVGNHALDERECGDVFDAVGGSDDCEQQDCRGEIRRGCDQHDRRGPEDQRPAERRCQPAASEPDRPERTQEAAGADRRCQIADLRCPAVEHLVRGDDDQHVQAAANERLCGDQRDE
jgi:hypothetical protein